MLGHMEGILSHYFKTPPEAVRGSVKPYFSTYHENKGKILHNDEYQNLVCGNNQVFEQPLTQQTHSGLILHLRTYQQHYGKF